MVSTGVINAWFNSWTYNDIPYCDIGDAGKVLTVKKGGFIGWVEPTSGGSSYTAGTGIDITNDEISVDDAVALKSDIPTTSDRATSALFLKDANDVVYQITVDTSGNLVATAQGE